MIKGGGRDLTRLEAEGLAPRKLVDFSNGAGFSARFFFIAGNITTTISSSSPRNKTPH